MQRVELRSIVKTFSYHFYGFVFHLSALRTAFFQRVVGIHIQAATRNHRSKARTSDPDDNAAKTITSTDDRLNQIMESTTPARHSDLHCDLRGVSPLESRSVRIGAILPKRQPPPLKFRAQEMIAGSLLGIRLRLIIRLPAIVPFLFANLRTRETDIDRDCCMLAVLGHQLLAEMPCLVFFLRASEYSP
nr:hypothetical protein Iba_chr09eCG1100 [Ipomoea batatas]